MSRQCVERPKDYRITIQGPVAGTEIENIYLNVDKDAAFLWRGYKLEFNRQVPGVAGGLQYQLYDNEGYSPMDSPIDADLDPNSFAWFDYTIPSLVGQNGGGQLPVLWNPQLVIPPGGRIGVKLICASYWPGPSSLVKFTFIGAKRYE